MPAGALVLVADGSEEVETAAPVDVLRRAGARVCLASVEKLDAGFARLGVAASRGVGMLADGGVQDAMDQTWDVVVVPGGMPGAQRIRDCEQAMELLLRVLQETGPQEPVTQLQAARKWNIPTGKQIM